VHRPVFGDHASWGVSGTIRILQAAKRTRKRADPSWVYDLLLAVSPASARSLGEGEQGGSPRRHRPCRARPADRTLVAEDRSAGGVRDRTGPEPAALRVALVRAGSVRHREPLVLGGHERSRPLEENRRSAHLHGQVLGKRSRPRAGSSPSSGTARKPH
jgi:hypothetical protein